MFHATQIEQRKSKRHTINVPVDLLYKNKRYPAQVMDISAGGAKVVFERKTLPEHCAITIDLPFLNQLPATVVWVNGKHCGIKFKDEQNRVNEFLYNLATYGTD
ncbi:PilZ domain-containing protein [Terasakiella pusilla]|jgi:c-di-GMP-binding flagellar brake protein YcgR|uniref:PilZ domain-containing protein n=1 Tax=Terasakiella pusilla TaxID=64973 RepID=UPI003AA867C3